MEKGTQSSQNILGVSFDQKTSSKTNSQRTNESQERVPLSQDSRCSRKVHRRQCQNTFASTQTSLTPTGRSSSVQQTFLVSKNTGPTPMEVGALVKAQVTKEEEAEYGGNDKGKSPGKNGGKDKKRQQGRLERQDHFCNLGQVMYSMAWYLNN